MAKYTTQVKTICEQLNGFEINEDDYNANIAAAAPQIFDNYPIFDESHRAELNEKILGHYYMWEIGQETYGQWKFRINQKMKEIMPYYNQLFETEDIFKGIDRAKLFQNVDYKEIGNEIGNEQRNNNASGDEHATDIKNETREQVGKEKDKVSFFGEEINTRDYKGKEKDKSTYSGKEKNKKDYTGSEVDTKSGDDTTTNTPNNKITKHWETDTPQGTIANVENESYLTNFSKDQESGSTTDKTDYNSSNTKSFNNRQDSEEKSFENRQDDHEKSFENRQDEDTKSFDNRYDDHEKSFENRKDISSAIATNNRNRSETTQETATRIANNIKTIVGKNTGDSYMDLIQKIRDIIINIDMQIIHDLRFQFMGVL